MKRKSLAIVALAALLTGGAATLVQGETTLWGFLGIPQGINKVKDQLINPLGNFPGLERKPKLKQIADPSFLDAANPASKVPALKKAAEIKMAEDLAPQKIKAIKYLAKVGCGCYPGVKEALMAALEDCTETVRYQAAKAIGRAAEQKCETCSKQCCCDEELTNLLSKIAYEKDDKCCWFEASERVREAAAEAMKTCCRMNQGRGDTVTPEPEPEPAPEQAPESAPEGGTTEGQPGEGAQPAEGAKETRRKSSSRRGVASNSSRRRHAGLVEDAELFNVSATHGDSHDAVASTALFDPPAAPAEVGATKTHKGVVSGFDLNTGTVHVDFAGDRPQVGRRGQVNHAYALETASLGDLEIVYFAKNGRAIAQPIGGWSLRKLSKGDLVVFRGTASESAPAVEHRVARRHTARKATAPTAPRTERVSQDAAPVKALQSEPKSARNAAQELRHRVRAARDAEFAMASDIRVGDDEAAAEVGSAATVWVSN